MSEQEIQCSYCPKKSCYAGDLSQIPTFCPTSVNPEFMEPVKQKLADPETRNMAQDVARTWKDYGKLTRVEETVLYAKLRGYKKIGLAFCVGLSQEAEMFTNLLLNEEFEVTSICCMNGGMSSDDVGLPDDDKIVGEMRQPMCNPVGQAMVLDDAGCELNVLLGLCVGDDALFIKNSKAPVTVLAVKDRVLAHNPLAALYTSKQIYTRINTRKPKRK